ncbi:uncharacterized protein LOC126995426 isoform X2 [Eriocheir sinensis]|uniref:uncharacterized protein LOC126995426 isoform X2 n=1 Tax=Eriocheir sinensis TaxID=95602 RepID=UPI0021CA2DD4|nr:uncharacterized protein LOC126995426 isoform X2 [Eriocheir sinensis]
MESNDSDAASLCKPKSGDSQCSIRSADATEDPDSEQLNATEKFSDSLLTNAQNNDTADCSDKQAHNDRSHVDSNTKCEEKASPGTEIPKSIFHLSANMKKDLSMLAYPSKTHARKKAVISSRITPNSRITIAEALEKAEDARKSMSSLHKSSNKVDNLEGNISNLPSQDDSTDKIVDTADKESQDVVQTLAHSATAQGKEKINLDSAVAGQSVTDSSPPNDAAEEAAPCSEGKTESVGGKAKPPGTSRVQMTRRMLAVLKFTFDHEHFPSSVHMARLAKMMGLPWSQVRNWFTDRRVENKKAGIYPRDKPLLHCTYCAVTLETEADQKGHLFSTQHVRTILGEEYCGGGTPESIKWKKLPKTVNAVSKMSGARILAVGFSAEDSKKKDVKSSSEKKVEPVVEGVSHSKELKKLWTEAMLLPEEKEPPLVEWNSVRFNQENNSDNKCESFKQEGKDMTHLNLPTPEEKEKVIKLKNLENMCAKQVVSNKVGLVSSNVSDMTPCSTSVNTLVTAKNSTLTSDVVVNITNYSCPVTTSIISEGMFRHPNTERSQSSDDVSVISEVKTSRKMTNFGKKIRLGGMMTESPIEAQRLSTASIEAPKKAPKSTFPYRKLKSKQKKFSWTNSISQEKLTQPSTFASQLMQDAELKQEHESDESWSHMNNITLYRADGTDAPEKCELAVVNANQQPIAITQSPATYRSYLPKSSQFIQKSSSVKYQPQIGKSGIRQAVYKMPRSIDKRRLKLQNELLALAPRDTRAKISVHEGNLIVGYQCPKCSKIFQTEWLMMKHSVTHFKYHCDICYQVYPDENMMKIHLLDHLSGAYEDEKYYCQFSCKVCHSLKCGCFEPTYCKPKDLPRVFFRPQKAKRSKRSFTSKLNTGPNDHLKISMSAYKKMMVSGSVGLPSKEIAGTSTSSKPTHAELTQNLTLPPNAPKSAAPSDSQKPNLVFKETKVPNTLAEAQKPLHIERDQEYVTIKVETNDTSLPKETGIGASLGVSGVQLEVRPNNNALEEKDIAKEKRLNWNEVRTKFTFKSKSHANSQLSGISKSTEAGDEKAAKRVVGRKRASKFSKNFAYEDTVFYQMCEICDASFSTKSELSEHMFLHRLKSRSRRGEKRNLSSDPKETESPKKIKVYSLEDQASTETVTEGPDNCTCELCKVTFTTTADYRAHKILAHKEPKPDSVPQSIEVYRCKYCEKVYRRRRELKRHLKRDCTAAPASLRGMLSGLSYSGNVIEDAHYTTLKIDFDDKPDTPPKSSGKGMKGPIVCKYCTAVTKREAEMKRHIWKFCLKVPVEVVKKFMDGASLKELGFKCVKDGEASAENIDMEESNNTNMEIPEALRSLDETASTLHSSFSKGLSPKKTSPDNTKIPPVKANILEELNSAIKSLHEKMETSSVQPEPSGNHNISKIHLEDSKKTYAKPEANAKQGPIKHLPKRTKMQPPSTVGDTGESSTSASPLVTSVMQFPIVLPVMAASAKSKRPLVCGYCGIWYFREMAILKHMKERCIKIPELEKELLKNNSVLCNVTQRGGIASENGAVYKMVKVPEHLQNTPVPMPKDVSNEDIKELNANIKAFKQNTPAKPTDAKVANVQDSLSSSSTVVKEQGSLSSSTEGKKQDRLSSSPAEVKEQDTLSPSPIKVKEQNSSSSSSRKVKEQDSLSPSLRKAKAEDSSSSPRKVKEQDSPSPSPKKVKEQDSSSSSPRKAKEQDSLSSPRKAKEQDSLSSPRKVKEQDSSSSSPRRVKEQDSLSSLRKVRKQNNLPSSHTKVNKKDSLSSSRKVKEQDSSSSSLRKIEEQDNPSPSPTKVREQNSLSSSRTKVNKKDSLSSSRVVKEQDSPSLSPKIKEQDSSSPSKVKGQDSPPSSPTKVKEQDSLSSSPSVVKDQDTPSLSPTKVKEQDTPSSSPTKVKDQDSPSSSPTVASEQDSLSSSSASPVKVNKTTTTKRGSRCRRCHEHFNSQEAVLAHSSVHHGPKKGFYKCKLCHARLAKYKQLREHVWEHTDENPYRCHLCGVKYRSSDALVDHLHTIHQFTSIYEKNLYKWLPGRHGRYREIKTKNSSCEENLDDMDTTLDSLAEVMVITDKDICSKTAIGQAKASKSHEMNEQSVDSDSMQEERKSLLKDSKSSADNALDNNKPQNKKMPSNSSIKISTDSNVSSNEGGKEAGNVNKDKSSMGDQNTLEKSVEKITRGSQSVKNAAALKESKDKGRTPQSNDLSKSKSESRVKEQNKIDAKIGGKVPEKNPQSSQEDDFTGEGFLPHIGNLDSVVETVHLTDEHLS